MRKNEVKILQSLIKQSLSLKELASKIDKSQSWTSELVSSLEDENLIDKNSVVHLSDTYEARLLEKLSKKFDLEKILTGEKEEILKSLISKPKKIPYLEKEGFGKSTLYDALNDLKEVGAVIEEEKGYKINDETLFEFIKIREGSQFMESYSTKTEKIIKTEKKNVEGEATAFSVFMRYGVDYYPSENYIYQGDSTIKMENALIHALKFTQNKKQMSMCAVFYLKHRSSLESDFLWKLAGKWDCLERFADLLAYIDQREVKEDDLFLPWDEFIEICRDYDIHPRNKFPKDRLEQDLKYVGSKLSEELDVFIIGGGNLIIRGLKDSTKDLDVILEDRKDLDRFVDTLEGIGYSKDLDLENTYDRLDARIVLEKSNHPRWDIFVKEVAGMINLSEDMKERIQEKKKYGRLNVNLISLTDIFLFKSVTDREGDLEDAALIMRKGEVEWAELFQEIKKQESSGERNFSFSVLTSLDILNDRYGLESPIMNKLSSYCLERSLLFSLKEEKTIKELKEMIDFPSYQIYNKLRKLEEEGEIEVDRDDKLNKYKIS